MFIIIFCALNKVGPACEIESVLVSVVLKIVDFHFPQTISKATA
jgi:hypothetical protein